jgi:hypothetical protein
MDPCHNSSNKDGNNKNKSHDENVYNNSSNNNMAVKTQQSTLEFGKEPDISLQTL